MENVYRTNLLEVDLEGEESHLEMIDGSKWFVNPGDLSTVATWLPSAPIRIFESHFDSVFSYDLVNLDIDVKVRAMRVA